MDGTSNYRGSGAGVALIAPCGTTHEHTLKLNFPASNNEAAYEALIAGLKIAQGLEVEDLVVYIDSQLVVNQVLGEYEAWDDRMTKYLETARELVKCFPSIKMEQVGLENSSHANALAGLVIVGSLVPFLLATLTGRQLNDQ